MTNDPYDQEDRELHLGLKFAYKLTFPMIKSMIQSSQKRRQSVENYALGLGTTDPSDAKYLNQKVIAPLSISSDVIIFGSYRLFPLKTAC